MIDARWNRFVKWMNNNSFYTSFLTAITALVLSLVALSKGASWKPMLFGASLALGGNAAVEYLKRWLRKRDDERFLRNAYDWLCWEIEEGIGRCQHFINIAQTQQFSYSRIHVDLWELVKERVSSMVKDKELVRSLYRIYYRFALINFNMEQQRFDVGAAFAQWHIDEVKSNFNDFKTRAGLV